MFKLRSRLHIHYQQTVLLLLQTYLQMSCFAIFCQHHSLSHPVLLSPISCPLAWLPFTFCVAARVFLKYTPSHAILSPPQNPSVTTICEIFASGFAMPHRKAFASLFSLIFLHFRRSGLPKPFLCQTFHICNLCCLRSSS